MLSYFIEDNWVLILSTSLDWNWLLSTCIYVHVCVCTYIIDTHIHIHKFMCVCIHTFYIHVYIYMYVCMYVYTCLFHIPCSQSYEMWSILKFKVNLILSNNTSTNLNYTLCLTYFECTSQIHSTIYVLSLFLSLLLVSRKDMFNNLSLGIANVLMLYSPVLRWGSMLFVVILQQCTIMIWISHFKPWGQLL